ncbi:MAG: hypothetical protein ACP5RJ_08380 [Conexivisphaera sp.]
MNNNMNSNMMYGEAGEDPFLHYIVTGWIRSHPREFLEMVRSLTGGRWDWSRGVPTFVQMEFPPIREELFDGAPSSLKYVDVFMKVNTRSKDDPVPMYYSIIIKVRTGDFTPKWVDLLAELDARSPVLWGTGEILITLFIARRREIDRLLKFNMPGKPFSKESFIAFPLEPLLERMRGDLLNVVTNHFFNENE